MRFCVCARDYGAGALVSHTILMDSGTWNQMACDMQTGVCSGSIANCHQPPLVKWIQLPDRTLRQATASAVYQAGNGG